MDDGSDLARLLARALPPGTLQLAARLVAIKRLAEDLVLGCDADELQAAADAARQAQDLLTYEATIAWLAARGWSADAWTANLECDLLERRLLAHPTIKAAARAAFDADPASCKRLNVGIIAVEHKGIAQEITILLRETRISFDTLARRYSILFADGVSAHPVSRQTLFAADAPQPFLAAVADCSGGALDIMPLLVDGLWHLYRLYSVAKPAFDTETREYLEGRALDNALRTHIVSAFADLAARLGCELPHDARAIAVMTASARLIPSP